MQLVLFPVFLLCFVSWTDCGTTVTKVISVSIYGRVPQGPVASSRPSLSFPVHYPVMLFHLPVGLLLVNLASFVSSENSALVYQINFNWLVLDIFLLWFICFHIYYL